MCNVQEFQVLYRQHAFAWRLQRSLHLQRSERAHVTRLLNYHLTISLRTSTAPIAFKNHELS